MSKMPLNSRQQSAGLTQFAWDEAESRARIWRSVAGIVSAIHVAALIGVGALAVAMLRWWLGV